jgi:hypothetical protein
MRVAEYVSQVLKDLARGGAVGVVQFEVSVDGIGHVVASASDSSTATVSFMAYVPSGTVN